MATSLTTRHISVASSTPYRPYSIETNTGFSDAVIETDSNPGAVPVKFGDLRLTMLIKDQIQRLLDRPEVKQLKYSDESSARAVTRDLIEILKKIIAQHTRENYKVIIQVMIYPKQDEHRIVIHNRCLWDYRTDDVLSIETETNAFKFLIIIHGVVG